MQFLFFIISLLVGPRMIYLVNKASWKTNMKQVSSGQYLDVHYTDIVSSALLLQRSGYMQSFSSI